MPEPTIAGFVPKCFVPHLGDADEMPVAFGSIPDQPPRVVTRLVPKDHGVSLPARIVSQVIDLKQDLALYAARDVAEGPNPNFADLTSLPRSLREAAQLAVEPAEPGSYVIPASLPARSDALDADAVVKRYGDLLAAIDDPRLLGTVSIGALQVCRKLGEVLRRGVVETLEVTTYDRENTPRPAYAMTAPTVGRLDRILVARRVASREYETLTGRLVALDVVKNEFQIEVKGVLGRVRGTGNFFFVSSLRERLGEEVTLEGEVVRSRNRVTMTAYAEVGESEPSTFG